MAAESFDDGLKGGVVGTLRVVGSGRRLSQHLALGSGEVAERDEVVLAQAVSVRLIPRATSSTVYRVSVRGSSARTR